MKKTLRLLFMFTALLMLTGCDLIPSDIMDDIDDQITDICDTDPTNELCDVQGEIRDLLSANDSEIFFIALMSQYENETFCDTYFYTETDNSNICTDLADGVFPASFESYEFVEITSTTGDIPIYHASIKSYLELRLFEIDFTLIDVDGVNKIDTWIFEEIQLAITDEDVYDFYLNYFFTEFENEEITSEEFCNIHMTEDDYKCIDYRNQTFAADYEVTLEDYTTFGDNFAVGIRFTNEFGTYATMETEFILSVDENGDVRYSALLFSSIRYYNEPDGTPPPVLETELTDFIAEMELFLNTEGNTYEDFCSIYFPGANECLFNNQISDLDNLTFEISLMNYSSAYITLQVTVFDSEGGVVYGDLFGATFNKGTNDHIFLTKWYPLIRQGSNFTTYMQEISHKFNDTTTTNEEFCNNYSHLYEDCDTLRTTYHDNDITYQVFNHETSYDQLRNKTSYHMNVGVYTEGVEGYVVESWTYTLRTDEFIFFTPLFNSSEQTITILGYDESIEIFLAWSTDYMNPEITTAQLLETYDFEHSDWLDEERQSIFDMELPDVESIILPYDSTSMYISYESTYEMEGEEPFVFTSYFRVYLNEEGLPYIETQYELGNELDVPDLHQANYKVGIIIMDYTNSLIDTEDYCQLYFQTNYDECLVEREYALDNSIRLSNMFFHYEEPYFFSSVFFYNESYEITKAIDYAIYISFDFYGDYNYDVVEIEGSIEGYDFVMSGQIHEFGMMITLFGIFSDSRICDDYFLNVDECAILRADLIERDILEINEITSYEVFDEDGIFDYFYIEYEFVYETFTETRIFYAYPRMNELGGFNLGLVEQVVSE